LHTAESVPSLSQRNGFDFAQELFQARCKTRVIDELMRNQSVKAFNGDVATIGRRLQEGKITATRQLELELICVGKVRLKHFLFCCIGSLSRSLVRSQYKSSQHFQGI